MEGIALLTSWKNMVGSAQRSRTCTEFLGLLRSCDESAVLLLSEVTPRRIMEYAIDHHHLWGGQGYLSKSAYGAIRAVG